MSFVILTLDITDQNVHLISSISNSIKWVFQTWNRETWKILYQSQNIPNILGELWGHILGVISLPNTRSILCMSSASERWRYNVTLSLIGWVHTQNDPCQQHLIKEGHSCGAVFHVIFGSCIFVSLQSLQWSSQGSGQDNRFQKTDMHVDFTHETDQYSLVHFKDGGDFMPIGMQIKWYLDMIYILYQ